MKSIDILPDNAHFVEKNGIQIRKGSIAAFIANAQIILSEQTSVEEKEMATNDLQELVPALKLVGLFDIFEVKSHLIKKLIE